jgi:hypothetical protein
MGFKVSDSHPDDISDVLDTGDYARIKGNGTDAVGQVKAINPEIALLKPHIKQQPTGDFESVDLVKQAPLPGHHVEQISEERYNAFEKTHIVNRYLDQPIHANGQGHGTTGVLRSFYNNEMTFQPYIALGPGEERVPVNETFTREYTEDTTIEPVHQSLLVPKSNIIRP